MRLTTAKIQNFKSLSDVELNFRDLTILVGSNASGKSNCLEALGFLSALLGAGALPSLDVMQRYLRFDSDRVNFNIAVEDSENYSEYSISMTTDKTNTSIASENLKVNGTEVINILEGKGKVSDENGGNPQRYDSNPTTIEGLALRAAGNFGNKPFTKKLAGYIKEWEFYDIDPEKIREYPEIILMFRSALQIQSKEIIPTLGSNAGQVQEVLNYWAENEKDKLEKVSEELENILKISLSIVPEGEQIVKVLEGEGKEMPLSSMSDGTLRLIAYLILLYQSSIPTLIGIEEPERNFHPGILKDVASVVKRLSKRTQVVLTTHSSQLLDCFSTKEISDEISVILLNKKELSGTKACLLDKLAENRDDLLDWMNEFGLGSAVYHSHLIEEILSS